MHEHNVSPNEGLQFRFDFVQEVINVDEKSGVINVRLIPDPRRYEWKEIDGKQGLWDKFDSIWFTEEAFADLVKRMEGMPIYCQPQLIDDADEYVSSRLPEVERRIKSDVPEPTFEDKSEEFLESLEVDQLEFVILCLDIVGSTSLATRLPSDKYTSLVSTSLFEWSSIIPLFHGHVLKYTGDGLIAYFPAPSFITKNDLAIDCALTLHKLTYHGLNPCFHKYGLPQIDIRIGLEAGMAHVAIIGSAATKQHKDIIGSVVSLASKIQGTAEAGGINLGVTAFRNLHTGWREICTEIALPKGWEYTTTEGQPYRIFRVKSQLGNAETT